MSWIDSTQVPVFLIRIIRTPRPARACVMHHILSFFAKKNLGEGRCVLPVRDGVSKRRSNLDVILARHYAWMRYSCHLSVTI